MSHPTTKGYVRLESTASLPSSRNDDVVQSDAVRAAAPAMKIRRPQGGGAYRQWLERTADAKSQADIAQAHIAQAVYYSVRNGSAALAAEGEGPTSEAKRPASTKRERPGSSSPARRNKMLPRVTSTGGSQHGRGSSVSASTRRSEDRQVHTDLPDSSPAQNRARRSESLAAFLNDTFQSSPLSRERVNKIFTAVLDLADKHRRRSFLRTLEGAITIMDEDQTNALKLFSNLDGASLAASDEGNWNQFGSVLWTCVARARQGEAPATLEAGHKIWELARKF